MKDTLMELVETCEKVNEISMTVDPMFDKATELEALGLTTVAKEILAKAEQRDKMNRVSGFIKITTQDIEKYLDKKVDEYNAEHQKQPSAKHDWRTERAADRWFGFGMAQIPSNPFESISRDYYEQQMRMQRNYMLALTDRGNRFSIDSVGFNPAMLPNNVTSISRRTCDYSSYADCKIGQFVWEETKLKDYKGIPPQKVLNRLREIIGLKIFDYFTIASVKGIKDPLLLGKIDGCEDRFFCDQWGEDVKIEELM